jgi:cold shock protein
MATGTVKWFNLQKGFGFIVNSSTGKDVFVHISAVEKAGLTKLNEGQQNEFELEENRGKATAVNLKVKCFAHRTAPTGLPLNDRRRGSQRCNSQLPLAT